MNPKPKRIRNPELLKTFREMFCVVQSNKCLLEPCTAEHWKTVGSGGDDVVENLNPMCQPCHVLKGSLGVKTFWNKYGKRIQRLRKKQGLPPMRIEGEND